MELTYELDGKGGYRILNYGVVWIVQPSNILPYPELKTLEEKAQKQIDEIIQSFTTTL